MTYAKRHEESKIIKPKPRHPLWYFLALFTVSLTCALLFLLVTLLVREDKFTGFDFSATVRIQNKIPRTFDQFLTTFTYFARFETGLVLTLLLWFVSRKRFAFLALALFTLMHVVDVIGKFFLTHAGPPFMFYRASSEFSFPSLYVHSPSTYPSGHSMRAVFVAVLYLGVVLKSKMNRVLKLGLSLLILLITGGVLITRVSLGEHWPSDVIGGVLLALASSAVVLLLY